MRLYSQMANTDQTRQHCCFQEWLNTQKLDLSRLQQTQTQTQTQTLENGDHEPWLSQLINENVQHFEDYMVKRNQLARDDVSAFFSPTWCTALENSNLWIGGCRPSLCIRLVYSLSGAKFESQLSEFLQGAKTNCIWELSENQVSKLNSLHMKTIREENKLSSHLASLDEEIADEPIALLAKGVSQIGELNREVENALNEHAGAMKKVLEAADQLRLSTLKELIDILTPFQAVDFLAATKKLHLCMHAWGRGRDLIHGRESSN